MSWYLVLTADIVLDKNLSDFDKILYGIITGLTRSKGFCYATNKYLAELLNVGSTKLRTALYKLNDKKYIFIQVVKDKNNHVLERRIYLREAININGFRKTKIVNQASKSKVNEYTEKTGKHPLSKSRHTPLSKSRQYNIKELNIKDINTPSNDFKINKDLKEKEIKKEKENLSYSNSDHIPILIRKHSLFNFPEQCQTHQFEKNSTACIGCRDARQLIQTNRYDVVNYGKGFKQRTKEVTQRITNWNEISKQNEAKIKYIFQFEKLKDDFFKYGWSIFENLDWELSEGKSKYLQVENNLN